jgi:hypothetical protein
MPRPEAARHVTNRYQWLPRHSSLFCGGARVDRCFVPRHTRRETPQLLMYLNRANFLSSLPTPPEEPSRLKISDSPLTWKCSRNDPDNRCFTNMALLAASRTAPTVSLSQRSEVISTIYPLVNSAVQFQHLIGCAVFHLFVRTYFAASIVATASLWASKSIAWRTFLASRVIVARALFLASRLIWTAWDCKRSRRFRKRLEFELFILLLGPGGNSLLLMLFWPGWLMLAATGWGVWHLTG